METKNLTLSLRSLPEFWRRAPAWARASAAGAAALVLVWAAVLVIRHRIELAREAEAEKARATAPVGCLGRIEPEDEVAKMTAPTIAGQSPVVEFLLVKEGDWVKAGQALAVLQSAPALSAALRQSQAQESLSSSRLASAKAEAKRHESLFASHDISASEVEQSRLSLQVARAQLEAARAAVVHAEADYRLSSVRAPSAGRILKIHTRPGEAVGPEGLLDLGDTSRMIVIAEVYETDVSRVRVGQEALIKGELLVQPLTGRVWTVESEISKNSTLPTDPMSFADSRVVGVKIRVADSQALAGLIHGKVQVVIRP